MNSLTPLHAQPLCANLSSHTFIQLPIRIIALLRHDFSDTVFKISKNMSCFVLTGLLVSWVVNLH